MVPDALRETVNVSEFVLLSSGRSRVTTLIHNVNAQSWCSRPHISGCEGPCELVVTSGGSSFLPSANEVEEK